jgi:hypothetical protein
MSSDQLKMYNALLGLDTETAINALLGWHGTQLLSSGFLSYLIDEGILFDDEGGR